MRTEPLRWSGAFRGVNMLTPEIVEYRRGVLRGATVHVEISRETYPFMSRRIGGDPDGGPAYGITIKSPDGLDLDPDPSTCVTDVRDFAQVEAALAAIE